MESLKGSPEKSTIQGVAGPTSRGGMVIEQGVSMPVRWSRGLARVLRQMVVGDSVFVPEGRGRSLSNQVAQLRRRMAADGETRHWTVRTVEGGVRVWRDQ